MFYSIEDGITTETYAENTLFYGKIYNDTPDVQTVSFRPDHIVYNKNSECVFIQNRFGIFAYIQNENAIKALPNIPNFLSGEEYSIYDLCKITISPNGRYLLYKKAVSPTRADIFMYDLASSQSTMVISSADRCPGEIVAKWSADSKYFIYQKNNKVYYFSIANYSQNRQLDESWRFIADIKLSNGEWTGDNRFIWADKEAIWECDTVSFAAKSIYSNYLQQGKAIASLPYPFRQQSHNFFYFPQSSQMLLVRNNGAAMLFNPNAPLENNSYLQLDTNIRVEKAKINQNGNGAVLLKILENGTFQKKLFLIKDKKFLAYSNNHGKINDFTLDNETLLISTSENAIALNLDTNETLWEITQKDIKKILPITTGHLLFGKDIAWLRKHDNTLQPLFLCSAPAGELSDSGTPIVITSEENIYEINKNTYMLTQLSSYPETVIKTPQNSKGRLLTREIKKSFYHNVVCFKETS
ncbi:MAG: hypothetical protein II258_07345, partial [Spirochaetales bacterium]|nr:hypothetical protein [Spirochaetales bacterium]